MLTTSELVNEQEEVSVATITSIASIDGNTYSDIIFDATVNGEKICKNYDLIYDCQSNEEFMTNAEGNASSFSATLSELKDVYDYEENMVSSNDLQNIESKLNVRVNNNKLTRNHQHKR